MKTIIIYATKSGASKECGEELASRLPGATIRDVRSGMPDLAEYDNIILGAGVRMGKIYTPMRELMNSNLEMLGSKRLSIYLCNAYPEAFEKAVAQNIPSRLTDSAIQIVSFGGKPPFRKAALTEWLNQSAFDGFVALCKSQKL